MAIIGGVSSYPVPDVLKYRVWELVPGDHSTPFQLPPSRVATVEVTGTFGQEGRMHLLMSSHRGATWTTAVDPEGAPLVFIAPGTKKLIGMPGAMFRFAVTGSDGTTSLDVTVIATGQTHQQSVEQELTAQQRATRSQ